MKQYLDLCTHILTNGKEKKDRTGTGTISIFGYQMRYNLANGFPLVTTKDMSESRLHAIIHELLWFLSGDTNIKYLVDNGVNIWNPDAHRHYKSKFGLPFGYKEFVDRIKTEAGFADERGDLGRIYGKQWRSFRGFEFEVDQIKWVIDEIKRNPDSRRLIVSAWNPTELDEMALPPCHVLFQFYVEDGKLSCQLYQRSGDVFLGVPFNIASYALLTMMIADQCDLEYGEFVHTLGDAHIYLNHVDQVREQIKRVPHSLPKMVISKTVDDIFSYKREDFKLVGYSHHPALKGRVSVGE